MTNTNVNNEFLSGEMTVTKSTAGSSTYTKISHSDNTNAASNAIVKIESGGGSGGDAKIISTNSVSTVAYGVDNSDSDTFIMSENSALGTSNVARCDTAGSWTYPLNSCFSVNANNTNALNVTGTGTVYYPHYNTERFNTGSDYDTTNYQYVCPVSGIYLFTCQNYVTGCTARQWLENYLYINGTITFSNTLGHANANDDGVYPLCCICACDAGDVVRLAIASGGEADNRNDFYGNSSTSYFMGALVS